VLREGLPVSEYRGITRKQQQKRYSDEQLLMSLREAAAAIGGVLTGPDYDRFSYGSRAPNGRPWPSKQTSISRFGSWRAALLAAGLQANPSSPLAGMRSFDIDQCIDAVQTVERALGRTPTAAEYDQYARRSESAIPSLSTVCSRCGTWRQALVKAGL
jgi:Homing endonuclease associated repeat